MKLISKLMLVILIMFAVNIDGTIQIPDEIIFKENTYNIDFYPLESFFDLNKDLKLKLDRMSDILSTGLSRGYVASFNIINSKLILENIEIDTDTESGRRSVMNDLFWGRNNIVVDTFNGFILLTERMQSIKIVEIISYDKYILLHFENGILTQHLELSEPEFMKCKETQISEFRKKVEYSILKEELLKHFENDLSRFDAFISGRIFYFSKKVLFIKE